MRLTREQVKQMLTAANPHVLTLADDWLLLQEEHAAAKVLMDRIDVAHYDDYDGWREWIAAHRKVEMP